MKYARLCVVILILISLTTVCYPTQFANACWNNSCYFEGKLDIGGYKLYIHSEGKGKPVVLYDSAYGDSSTSWKNVQQEISETVRSVSYDRAGLGKSDVSPYPRTSYYMAKEWHRLLNKAEINGPYILVGHSMGSFNARLFAALYPGEVAGLILVDSSHEDQNAKLISILPPEIQEAIKSEFNKEGTYEDFLTSAEQVRATRGAIRYIPLTVITATNHGMGGECEKIWMDMQNDLASLSIYSKHIIANGSTHYIQNDQPEIVINAIKDMINLIKRKHN